MNKQAHRLVFDRRRGMRVPAAEHVKAVGKAAGGESRARAVRAVAAACAASTLAAPGGGLLPAALLAAAGLVAIAAPQAAEAQSQPATRRSLGKVLPRSAGRSVRNLPVLSTDAARTQYNRGAFSVLNPSSSLLQINQVDQRVIINWDSFDIGRGYTVRFVQPDKGSALNNIWANDPSVILGKLEANGEVILQNQNGVIFGPTARVQTQRFVTTALKLAEETFMKGLRDERSGNAVFGGDDQSPHGFINIERGAEIKALAGGDVILVAPRVYNEGRIETPGGQTVLAAGQKVFLMGSTDFAQRGLIVAVDSFAESPTAPEGLNTVEQAEAGTYQVAAADGRTVEGATAVTAGLVEKINSIVAEKGSINLVGMTVRQNGVLSATTAVKGENGAIYLQGMKNSTTQSTTDNPPLVTRVADELGTVELGVGSQTRVTPSLEAATQKDADIFYRSRIEISGRDVRIGERAQVQAVSGNIVVRAAERGNASIFANGESSSPDNSRLVIDGLAELNAAGLRDHVLPMSRNQLSLGLYQNELADSPVQRGGALYRNTVFFDARRPVAVANVKGAYNLIERTAQELSTRGGNITLQSMGSLVVSDDAKLNISGGSKRYTPGQVFNSSLSRLRGGVVSLLDADPRTRYDRLINPVEPGQDASSLQRLAQRVEQGYVEGDSAGHLTFQASSFYLGGDIQAGVILGPRQRSGAPTEGYVSAQLDSSGRVVTLAADSNELGRAKELVTNPHLYASLRPKAGSLTVNTLQTGSEITLSAAGAVSPGAVPDFGSDGANEWFSALGTDLSLSTVRLQRAQLGTVNLKTAGRVRIGQDVDWNLGASGQLRVEGMDTVELAGRLKAEGGKVSLTSSQGDVLVSSQAIVDLAGRTMDERQTRGGEDGVSVNGGEFSAKASRSVILESGSRLDMSAGQWITAAGTTSKGKAGAISLEANSNINNVSLLADAAGRVDFQGATLAGYGFKEGGTLSLSGMLSLWIGNQPEEAGEAWRRGMTLAPDFFSNGGFSRFSLAALGDVTVAPGTQLVPVLSNLVTTQSATRSESAPVSTAVGVLPKGQRAPIQLVLEASLEPSPFSGAMLAGSNLTVGEAALIDVGAGGRIALRAGGSQDIAGTLKAQGGQVSLNLLGRRGTRNTTDVENLGYLEDQLIRLKAGSLIDVSGTAKTYTTATGRVNGEVLAGGVVNLNVKALSGESADDKGKTPRGRLLMEQGAVIDVSGVAAPLHLGSSRTPSVISASAGAVNVESADGFALRGTFKAFRPDDSVAGGSFSVRMRNTEAMPASASGGVTLYPSGERHLVLVDSAQQVIDRPLAFGEGVVSAQQLTAGGFDRVTLSSDRHLVLDHGASLVADPSKGEVPLRAVTLDAPVLQAADALSHRIQATYVSLGDKTRGEPAGGSASLPITGQLGPARLNVEAGLIEMFGDSAFQGFNQVALRATLDARHRAGQRRDGEVRFAGRAAGENVNTLKGSLSFAGNLLLQAGQVYATTLSAFEVKGDAASLLSIEAPQGGSSSLTPLSALAQLKLKAHDVVLNGVVRQPFGNISVEATGTAADPGSITTGPENLLSVSGDGVTVPVGVMTNGGRQWVYATGTGGTSESLDPQTTASVQTLDAFVLNKSVSLTAATLSIDPGSRVEAQAGGDLQAWEFIPGVGGTKDTLNRPDVFAIVPTYRYDFAPYDTEVAATSAALGSTFKVGDQVRVETPSGVLAAGTYTLLPARYALMPGAVLVSAGQLPSPQPLARAIAFDDGSTLVSGHFTAVGTAQRGGNDARLGLLLEPEATFRAKSAFSVMSINEHKAGASTRPGDGGGVSLSSPNRFNWAARYNLKGGYFDLSMTDHMTVVAEKPAVVDQPEGGAGKPAEVWAQALSGTGADSILLGGTRSRTGDATSVTTSADTVDVNASISSGELLAVAKTRVQVADGVTLSSLGADRESPHTYQLSGEGAALLVGSNTAVQVQRSLAGTPSSTSGQLMVGKGVKLTGGNVQLDASGLAQVVFTSKPAEEVAIEARTLGLGVPRLAMGSGPAEDDALVLQGGLLASASKATRVQLRAYQGIQFTSDVSFGGSGTRQLVVDAPSLQGAAATHAWLTAQEVVLRNTTGQLNQAQAGEGKLTVQASAQPTQGRTGGLTIGQGQQRLAFNDVEMAARGDVIFDRGGTQADAVHGVSAQGNVTLTAARVTATGGTKHALTSGKLLTVQRSAEGRTLGEVLGGGADLTFTGQRVVQSGTIELQSGNLKIKGTGEGIDLSEQSDTVVFAAGSKTQTKGWVAQAGDTWKVSTQGGDITATAVRGQVAVRGELDVSAPAKASSSDASKSAGKITLSAAGEGGKVVLGSNARLLGSADTNSLAARLVVDTQELVNEPKLDASGTAVAAATRGNLDRLATLAREGGLHGGMDVRVRDGDVSLDTTMKAVRARISADQGKLTLFSNAIIDAQALQGGVVQLAARDDVELQGDGTRAARILADASPTRASNGGDVMIESRLGRILLGQGAAISAQGDDRALGAAAEDGRIVLRFNGQPGGGENPGIDVNGTAALNAGQVLAVGVLRQEAESIIAGPSVDGTKVLGQDTLAQGVIDFLATQQGRLGSFGLESTPNAELRAELEIWSDGDLTVADAWNLQDLHRQEGQAPVMLTLRASGHLNVNGSISDGFTSTERDTTTPVPILPGHAGSMRLVAGADLTAVDVLKTQQGKQVDLTIASEKLVRTTDGSIELAASRDIVLARDGTAASTVQGVAYVAGRLSNVEDNVDHAWAQFTEQGGRFEAMAGVDIKGPSTSQMIGNWLHHVGATLVENTATGETSVQSNPDAVAWWSAFDSFRQGFGSFGGGNLHVEAGQDLVNMGVVSPTSARHVVDADGKIQALEVANGGDVTVQAGRDVHGGVYLLGRGNGLIKALGSITTGSEIKVGSQKLEAGAMVGLMDGTLRFEAGQGIDLALAYNPTLGPSPVRVGRESAARYSTYAPDSTLSLSSVSGNVNWDSSKLFSTNFGSDGIFDHLHANTGFVADADERAKDLMAGARRSNWHQLNRKLALVAPPVLRMSALGGNLSLATAGSLAQFTFPSSVGDVSFYSAQNVRLPDANFVMGDGDPLRWPAIGRPIAEAKLFYTVDGSNATDVRAGEFTTWIGAQPLETSTLHRSDPQPARIFAGNDLVFGVKELVIPKPAELVAGRDVLQPNFAGQHFDASDATLIKAGRDLLGSTNPSSGGIRLMGPGELQVEAGRSLDLNNSLGVQAFGNTVDAKAGLYVPNIYERNQALGEDAAKIRLSAGTARSVQVDDFAQRYLADAFRQAQLVDHVKVAMNLGQADLPSEPAAAYAAALALFRQLPSDQQLAFAQKVIDQAFVAEYLSPGRNYEEAWKRQAAAAGVATDDYSSPAFGRMKVEVMMAEVERYGNLAVDLADSTDPVENDRRKTQRDLWWSRAQDAISLAGIGRGYNFTAGDIDLAGSRVYSRGEGGFDRGGIDLFAPGGNVVVGLNKFVENSGVVTFKGGNIRSVLLDDFLVNRQKVFVVGEGNVTVYSMRGAINSGTGSNTDVAAIGREPLRTADGVKWEIRPPTSGSGLAILQTPGARKSLIQLFAPVKGILALDAFIRNESGGDIKVQGPVQGADNLKGSVKGAAAPVVRAGLKVGGNLPTETTASSEAAAQRMQGAQRRDLGSILTVELTGMGADALQATGGRAAVREDCDRNPNPDCPTQ